MVVDRGQVSIEGGKELQSANSTRRLFVRQYALWRYRTELALELDWLPVVVSLRVLLSSSAFTHNSDQPS